MNDRCLQDVWERGGWHSHRCGKPTKWVVRIVYYDGREGEAKYVCGIHKRSLLTYWPASNVEAFTAHSDPVVAHGPAKDA